MQERPIIFNSLMVRAILDGRKTMTRRIIKPQPTIFVDDDLGAMVKWTPNPKKPTTYVSWCSRTRPRMCALQGLLEHSPYGQVGDELYVRETWAVCSKHATGCPQTLPIMEYTHFSESFPDCIQPGYELVFKPVAYGSQKYAESATKWRPSIHMPKWAARIFLEITDIRVERVQDITASDARDEGVIRKETTMCDLTIDVFERLWDSINKKRGYAWDKNPWVWVIEFEKVKQ